MNTLSRGFTLTEVMIVVAIIAIWLQSPCRLILVIKKKDE